MTTDVGAAAQAQAGAWIAGRPATMDAAIEATAKLLRRGRLPLIAGLSADVAAIREALRLGRTLRGVVDHMHSRAMLHDLSVMRETGSTVTTPLQARARADLLLLVGPGIGEAWPGVAQHLLGKGSAPDVLYLGPGRGEETLLPGATVIRARHAELAPVLGQLLALLRGRTIPKGLRPELAACADTLAAAKYGVVLWAAAKLEPVIIEMICALIEQLNERTRFAGLPIPPGDNAWGASQTAAWMTGYPLPVSFTRGAPEHDPWQFDAKRLADSEEADAALWLSACGPSLPPWRRRIPVVSLASTHISRLGASDVAITVGRPGVDHPAVLFDQGLGALAAVPASAPSAVPSAAAVLSRIAALAAAEPAAC